MCNLVKVKTNYGKDVLVADIKKDFIEQVIVAAGKCPSIDKIIIFGSASRKNCREDSDVDIAVFTSLSRDEWFSLEDVSVFKHHLFGFSDQEFDLIYRNSADDRDYLLNKNIHEGVMVYERR